MMNSPSFNNHFEIAKYTVNIVYKKALEYIYFLKKKRAKQKKKEKEKESVFPFTSIDYEYMKTRDDGAM